MNILIDIGHPAHVHLFRNCAENLVCRGHKVKFTAREKESTTDLLKAYNLDYELRGSVKKGMLNKATSMLSTDKRIYKIAKNFKADILIGVHNPYTSQVARLMNKRSITFTDTEGVKVASRLTFPFTDTIITPTCFLEKLDSKKHIRIDGCKELAYLHPKYFQPDPAVPEELGISKDERYIIARFISWAASHDVGLKGIGNGSEKEFIEELENYGRVLITSERKLTPDLERYRIACPAQKIHSLLSYAQLYIGEGGTMTTESGILGTPAIHIESTPEGIPTGSLCGLFLELRDKYDLIYFYASQDQALEKAVSILENPNSKSIWQKKRDQFVKDKIDVTEWLTEFIDHYPKSFIEFKSKETTTKK